MLGINSVMINNWIVKVIGEKLDSINNAEGQFVKFIKLTPNVWNLLKKVIGNQINNKLFTLFKIDSFKNQIKERNNLIKFIGLKVLFNIVKYQSNFKIYKKFNLNRS